MPIPAVLAAAGIQAGANIIGSGINAISTGRQNKKQRKWNEKMYARQRADALSDWAMQNEYNSPRAQMQRLQEANLNPHLVYGGSGVTEAGSIRSTDAKPWNPTPTNPGEGLARAGSSVLDYYDMEIKKAQADNLTAMNTNILLDALKKKIDIENGTLTLQQRKDLDAYTKGMFEVNPLIRKYMQDDAIANTRINLTYQQEQVLLQQIRHNEDKHPGNLEIQIRTIKQMLLQAAKTSAEKREVEARIKSVLADEKLKRLHIQLRENGIEPTDPQWQRLIIRAINGEGVIGKLRMP